MNDKSQVEYILNDIRSMVDNVIIKLSYIADSYDTLDIKREADRFVAAYMERDNFNSYRQYPIDVLVNAGITDINLLVKYNENRNLIPRDKRKEVLHYMRKAVISEYVEMNDYYRELIGMPSVNTPEEEYIYLTEAEMEYYNIDEVRPIHDYPKEIQIKLERFIIPKLIEQYPERTYLQHMGSKSVDLVRARQARNFEIIFTDIQLDTVFLRSFFETYDMCREYFVSMIYNANFKQRYDLYDNFIGMHIMIMTIQRLIVDTIKICIDRDFYDLVSIKKLFNVYGLPFYEDLPLDYQRMICKNVNWLLRCKSTDKVLYDVANTLFYERIDLHKFFLIKDRKFDENGEPVFKFKYVATDDKYDEDLRDCYLRDENGEVYRVSVYDGEIVCLKTDNVLEYYIEDYIYMQDRDTNVIYMLFIKKGELRIQPIEEEVKAVEEITIFDDGNLQYNVYISNSKIVLEQMDYGNIEIDYSNVIDKKVNVYLKSDNDVVYELQMLGDVLETIPTNVSSASAVDGIRIINEYTGEKQFIYMSGDRLCGDVLDDDLACEDLVVFNDEGVRFKIVPNKGRLETFVIDYRIKKIYDYESMFDVYFQSVELLESNISNSLEQKKNRYYYDEVTEEDVYWWNTEELKKELYEREYNFIDTKYIGINLMQNLTKLIYETSYYLNLLVDHKDTTVPVYFRILNSDAMKTGTDYLYLTLDRISSTPISIFDTVMVLCALVSKKNGMKGNIIVKSPTQILSVLGFNFEANFDLIRENIKKYKRVFKNQDILKYLDLLDVQSISDIDTIYTNFRNFAEFCEEMISTTNDINEYKAYKELYKTIAVREDMTKLFTLSDGSVANTYLEYLYDKLPSIAEFIDSLHKDKTGVYIEHAIGKLSELVTGIEYLYSLNGTNNNIINALIGLLNFFKSYTVDLRNLNVVYMCDNKRMNKIYMINDPRLFIQLYPNENLSKYLDNIRYYVEFDKHDNLIIYNTASEFIKLNPKEKFNTDNIISSLHDKMIYDDSMELMYKDMVEAYNEFGIKDELEMKYFNSLINFMINKETYDLESLITIYNGLNIEDNMHLQYKDLIRDIIVSNIKNEIFRLNIHNNVNNNYDINEMDIFIEKQNMKTVLDREYVIPIFDDIVNYNKSNHKQLMTVKDSIKVIYED